MCSPPPSSHLFANPPPPTTARAAVRFRLEQASDVASAFGMNGARLECGTQQRRGRQAQHRRPSCPRPNATPPLPIDEGSRGRVPLHSKIKKTLSYQYCSSLTRPLGDLFRPHSVMMHFDTGSGQATPIRLVLLIRQSISLIYGNGVLPNKCTYLFVIVHIRNVSRDSSGREGGKL